MTNELPPPPQAELVFIPIPGRGHLQSTVEMAKILVARNPSLSITLLTMRHPFDDPRPPNEEDPHDSASSSDAQSQLSKDAPQRIRFVELPQDESTAGPQKPRSGKDFAKVIAGYKNAVRDAVSKIISGNPNVKLAGFVIDMFCTPMIDVANEFGVPTFLFFTSTAAFLGLLFHFQALQDHHNQDFTLFVDPHPDLSVPSLSRPIAVKYLPSVMMDKNGGAALVISMSRRFRETKGILLNSFTELESYAIQSLSQDDSIPKIYPVGPVLSLEVEGGKTDVQQYEAIMSWLGEQPESSVVFLCFGSMGHFDKEQVSEIAHALERSGHRFLWSLRRPPPKDAPGFPTDYEEDLKEVLPEGFKGEMGKVIGWAPQVAVLSHPAVGGFVSHCGWNSTLESLWFGVPMAAWPLYAEQKLNAFELVKELEVAVEIKLDYKRDFITRETTEVVRAEEIERGIRQLMGEDDGSTSRRRRQKVREMSEKSRSSVREGGSSYKSVGRFIDDLLVLMNSS
ncbi:anthocyanidin 3-O-glucosyltransferase 2-like [Diospyros lotus]|uniref:anthocyanidin 3-O-glucosyltransferase 2-like n=1 Tax=Diospyros lotus TaxID=55363 RepID=UPI00225355F6|nr:anthocyanidin 3-O-glucosyltransferase 2-like [Diospyros lotus]